MLVAEAVPDPEVVPEADPEVDAEFGADPEFGVDALPPSEEDVGAPAGFSEPPVDSPEFADGFAPPLAA